ncbi:ArdC family protein [Mesotoga sp.]|uniref:ArdC family protein n=1 Tax=Mesotoga sp. TaxID=2053577 RepID=UPI00345EC9BD
MKLTKKELDSKLDSIVNCEAFARALKFKALQHSYSHLNCILIQSQRSNVTYVLPFKKWNALGVSVQKGEKGLAIIVPRFRKVDKPDGTKDDELVGFATGHVFDISQTDAPPDFLIAHLNRDFPGYQSLIELSPVPVIERPLRKGLSGYFDSKELAITISSSLSEADKALTLLHETGHYLVWKNKLELPRELEEVMVECSAFIAASKFGLDATAPSAGYIAGYLHNTEDLRKVSKVIDKISNGLLNMYERSEEYAESGS